MLCCCVCDILLDCSWQVLEKMFPKSLGHVSDLLHHSQTDETADTVDDLYFVEDVLHDCLIQKDVKGCALSSWML